MRERPHGGSPAEGQSLPRSAAKAVRLEKLEKRFGDVPAVRSLDLEVEAGELVVLVGPSGCGKTTVLRMIAGLEEPTAGAVLIGNRDVTDHDPAERDIAMVFQNYALYPHMSVRQNLAFGLRMRRTPAGEIDRRLERAGRVLGLNELLDRRPGQLSGGQRQRVALGRAIVREPAVFLFDEPLSNLDARLRLEMRSEIAGLHARLGTTTVFVTHDQVEAMTLGQRIAILHEGALQQFAPPLAVYREPSNLFVAKFIGTPPINTVEGELEGSRFDTKGWEVAVRDVAHAGPCTLAVRPEALRLVRSEDREADLGARVRRLEPLGNELLVHLDGPFPDRWIARTSPDAPWREEDRVGVRLDRARMHLFETGTGRRIDRGVGTSARDVGTSARPEDPSR